MFDPIGGVDRIKRFYLSYLETAFRIDDPAVSKARRDLLEESGTFALDPIIELVPRYKQWKGRIEDLADVAGDAVLAPLTVDQRAAFAELALSGLFPGRQVSTHVGRKGFFSPYEHQIEMLTRGLVDGSPGIVTSGTGSGKTESFMLPIIAQIVKEASSWPKGGNANSDWYQQRGHDFESQRVHEAVGRPKALRALILYPMNALVEDQMVRLRKTLDSDAAREVMQRRLNGNRIYFARYNRDTQVTGFRVHPRLADQAYEQNRVEAKKTDLKSYLREAARMETEVRLDDDRRLAIDPDADLNRYLFPSVSDASNETVDRWNIQETPPDLLVTNYAMLNALLVREVDAPILDKTREWILGRDDARFFLVMDELHLVRGSGGGEIAGLLRMLLHRLGLTDPAHRHKLRILASSASLPVDDGERGESSLRYLWNMFGDAGTYSSPGAPGATGPIDWKTAVVTGRSESAHVPRPITDRKPLADFADELERCASSPPASGILQKAIEAVTGNSTLDKENLSEAVRHAAGHIASACSAGPMHCSKASETIFGIADTKAFRGLAALRALPDFPKSVLAPEIRPAKTDLETLPAFRLHAFFRSIEGLFASIRYDAGKISWGTPSVERGETFDPKDDEGIRFRRFEMLYCESCGELFVGGRRGGSIDGTSTSLLPTPQDLEALPEMSSSGRFEDSSYLDYALFWPNINEPNGVDPHYSWKSAFLDPRSGIVRGTGNEHSVPGRLLRRLGPNTKVDAHKRQAHSPATAVPYCCPRCTTDYSLRFIAANSRKREGRLSPLRSFRTGFGKTSQILATELITFLKSQEGDGKLVAFSDSRGDAARLALDLEEQHQRDLRRELLVETARQSVPPRPDLDALDLMRKQREEMIASGDFDGITEIHPKIKAIERLVQEQDLQPSIAISSLLETQRGFSGNQVRPVLQRLIEIGANPEEGPDHGLLKGRPWNYFFKRQGTAYNWINGSNTEEISDISDARKKIMNDQSPDATDLLFSKTYFAFEETGLGWPSFFGRETYDDDKRRKDALLRIFADAYRVLPNRFMETTKAKPWDKFEATSTSKRFTAVAKKLFQDPKAEIDGFLAWLAAKNEGRLDGRIDVSDLYVRLADPADPYWRCLLCGRVHLHTGLGRCTRCATPLGEPKGIVAEIRGAHYLGARVERSLERGEHAFRLRCAELTGQSGEPSQTLRKFKGIFVKRADETEDQYRLRAKAEDLDLVSVTTTMEVGVDIGSLEAVYQANMPPQRFNYQQRVGRAGRRGQAFSAVLTVCRSRSHDIHYFRNPLLITGELPPPPFITTGLEDIPSRLLRKFWLAAAFRTLRDRAGTDWSGDGIKPPDIHGEFVYCSEYFDEGKAWAADLRIALEETSGDRLEVASLLADASDVPVEKLLDNVSVDKILTEVEKMRTEYGSRRIGLASALAEAGLIPLYGLPTRTRNLYVGLKSRKEGRTFKPDWDKIDREQDVAIHEFAPGSMLIRDKRRHLAIGFTGDLHPPSPRPGENEIKPYDNWVREKFSLGFCKRCGNWEKDEFALRACSSCQSPIEPDQYSSCMSPAGYRTDFRPKAEDGRSIGRRDMTLAGVGPSSGISAGNLNLLFEERSQIHKVNAGPLDETGQPIGFRVEERVDSDAVRFGWRGPLEKQRTFSLSGQAIEEGLAGDYPYRWKPSDTPDDAQGWLVSSKVTNALHVTPKEVSPLLRIADVEAGAFSRKDRDLTSVRAAAISATQMIILRAALELDVAPEEFEALAPRSMGQGKAARPFLQIADTLVNGSGFCRHLQVDGRHSIGKLIDSILNDETRWPLSEVLKEGHPSSCDQSCYRCLQRYGNRNLHGLLDWRLGLSYLRSIQDPAHTCGLDGNFAACAELRDWRYWANEYVNEIEAYIPGTKVDMLGSSIKLPAFTIDREATRWVVVVHPLWKRDDLVTALGLPPGSATIDTFELARRPVATLDLLRC